MVAMVWALVQAVLSLLWLLIEILLGWHAEGVVHAHEVLWFIIPPVVAVGAMVHNLLRTQGAVTYLRSLKAGLLTTLTGTIASVIIWGVYIAVLDPGFLDLHEASAIMRAKAGGMNEMQVAQMARAARTIFSVPTFYIVSIALPMVAGSLSCLVAAIGIRRRA